MAVTKSRAADGSPIFTIDPMPRAHYGVIHQPGRSSVVLVNAGQVILLVQREEGNPEEYCNGFAAGAAKLKQMTITQLCDTECGGDVCETYALYCGGQLTRGGLTYSRKED